MTLRTTWALLVLMTTRDAATCTLPRRSSSRADLDSPYLLVHPTSHYLTKGTLSLSFFRLNFISVKEQGAISVKLQGDKLAAKLVYFVLKQGHLNLSETAPRNLN